MNIESHIRIKLFRMYWKLGLFGTNIAKYTATQLLTYSPNYKIPQYNSITQIQEATSKLKWTTDPWDGKLDIVKHSTFMQEAIEKHPDYSGDCDDFANYWVASILKNNLAKNVYVGFGFWRGRLPKDIVGHACCVFEKDNKWYWVSNWYSCEPQEIGNSSGWIDQMLSNKKLVLAGKYPVLGLKDIGQARDTVIYGPAKLLN
jgi:hypothetical protein